MTVICDICQAANRDKAMFCGGCARKLQAFLANGPSMLSSLDTSAWRHFGSGSRSTRTDRPPRPAEPLLRRAICHSWLAGAMLIATGVAAALAWNGLSSALPSQPPPHAVDVSHTSEVAPLTTHDEAAPKEAEATTPPVLAPQASEEPSLRGPAVGAARQATGSGARSRQAPSVRRLPTPGASMGSSIDDSFGSRSPRDPRAGCQHLFFAFAARCTANHCFEAPYAAHPHCD